MYPDGDGPPPRVFNIPAHVPFLDALASQVLAEHGKTPEALTQVRILLPTRRACRALAFAFLRAQDKPATLLPRMQPIGDIDQDDVAMEIHEASGESSFVGIPPAISPIRRELLLTKLILALRGNSIGADQAARLARALARLIDQVHTERCDWQRLDDLVPDQFAEHWQITLDFLRLVTEHWPRILSEEGCIDPADRRNRLLAAQAAAWRLRPPDTPVIAAGSTGSIPATADLLRVVARLPTGCVILPGLDTHLGDDGWEAVSRQASHPQHAIARLLKQLRVDPADVASWPGRFSAAPADPRSQLFSEALRPPDAAGRSASSVRLDKAVSGLALVEVATPVEEARVIALLMREALESPERTAALVTPDRRLARRVRAELKRWDIEVDDSAGTPLAETVPGAFLRLVGRMVAEDFAPVPLLAALKHPLARSGMPPDLQPDVHSLELLMRRLPRSAGGLAPLQGAASASRSHRVVDLLEFLEAAVSDFKAAMAAPSIRLADLVMEHARAAEALTDGTAAATSLWGSEEGEALSEFLEQLMAAADGILLDGPRGYPGLLDTLLAGQVVRPAAGKHPRLAIWGPLEARLQTVDTMILGGLNEESWPPRVDPGPWMSRPMLDAFGLAAPERRIGLSAHDFCGAIAAAPVTWITRARRVEGVPQVPARWLTCLASFLRTAAPELKLNDGGQWIAWQALLDRPSPAERQRIGPPRPRPPVAARPRQLSVTRVETWMRDPYAIYAEFVLNLIALPPIDPVPGAADYGTFVHTALDRFAKMFPDRLPDDALPHLLACGRALLDPYDAGIAALWWPRFERVARWLLYIERQRGEDIVRRLSEVKGKLSLAGPAGRFDLTATADRVDIRSDGSVSIIDFKTGTLPKKADTKKGFSPQLPLEAVILANGGFDGIAASRVGSIEYWRVRGSAQGGERKVIASADCDPLARHALQGLANLISVFDREETPYEARPRASAAPRFSDYEHLARCAEWATTLEPGE